ncbi:MAG: hypothetical protein EA384_04165 [Spirochaetaceae bacterium]|nr:MAG: hypothetical protein EA384_04165 [Spirochaetaceae bacterium]
MYDLIGLAAAYAMIIAVIAIAGLLLRNGLFTPTLSRKFIHISVAHWWLIAMLFHTRALFAAIGPATFIVFNWIAYRRHLLAAMEDPEHRRNLGTVYFPISLLILVLLCYGGPLPLYVGAIGVLVMGYGDGLASVVGSRWGRLRITLPGIDKSVLGSATMFLASGVVVALFMLRFQPTATTSLVLTAAAATAAAATLIELATPFGFDNITVPIGTALFFFVVFA